MGAIYIRDSKPNGSDFSSALQARSSDPFSLNFKVSEIRRPPVRRLDYFSEFPPPFTPLPVDPRKHRLRSGGAGRNRAEPVGTGRSLQNRSLSVKKNSFSSFGRFRASIFLILDHPFSDLNFSMDFSSIFNGN